MKRIKNMLRWCYCLNFECLPKAHYAEHLILRLWGNCYKWGFERFLHHWVCAVKGDCGFSATSSAFLALKSWSNNISPLCASEAIFFFTIGPKQWDPLTMDQNLQNCEPKETFFFISWLSQVFCHSETKVIDTDRKLNTNIKG